MIDHSYPERGTVRVPPGIIIHYFPDPWVIPFSPQIVQNSAKPRNPLITTLTGSADTGGASGPVMVPAETHL